MPEPTKPLQEEVNLLIGTYTAGGRSKGLYVYGFDLNSGRVNFKSETAIDNPSYLTLSDDKAFVYAVCELREGADVKAFRYEPFLGKLAYLNRQLSGGGSPCHISTDRQNKHVFVSNYHGKNLNVLKIQDDGSLGKSVQLIAYEGRGPHEIRQKGPHIHSANLSIDGKHLFVQDLGTDKIMVYQYRADDKKNPLQPAEPRVISTTPGGGPRHITFSKDGNHLYLVHELTASISVYQIQEAGFECIQEINMFTERFKGELGAAHLQLSSDGHFLYASNRGDADEISIFQVNKTGGQLTFLMNQPVFGKSPRHFVIAPGDKYLLVANEKNDEVVVFARDVDTGLLSDTGTRITVGAPVCLVFDK